MDIQALKTVLVLMVAGPLAAAATMGVSKTWRPALDQDDGDEADLGDEEE